MGDSVRSNMSSFSMMSRRSSSDFSETDLKRLEELREIGKSAKSRAADLDSNSAVSTLSKGFYKKINTNFEYHFM